MFVAAVVEILQTSSSLVPMNTKNQLVQTINSFIVENEIVIQAIIVHPNYLEHITDVVTSVVTRQCIEVYAIQEIDSEMPHRKNSAKYIRADALFRWFIIFVQDESNMLYQIIRRAQKYRHVGVIFLIEFDFTNSLNECLIRNIISKLEPSETVVISMHSIEIMSAYLHNQSLIVSPYLNTKKTPHIIVSIRHNSVNVLNTENHLQGFDIWISLLLARMMKKTVEFRLCLPHSLLFVPSDEDVRQRFDRMPTIIAQHNANLEYIHSNTPICDLLYAEGSHLHANSYTRPKHFVDMYPMWRVDFVILVPNWKASNFDMSVTLMFFVLFNIYPVLAAIVRRVARNLSTQVHTAHTMLDFYYDTFRTLLGVPGEMELTNPVDRFLLICTSMLAMMVASTVSTFLFKVHMLSVRYSFNNFEDVVRSSQLPIYALNVRIGTSIMHYRLNANQISHCSLPQIMELMHEDNGQAAIILSTESLLFVQRNFGFYVKNFRLLKVPCGHRLKSFSLANSAIRLAGQLKCSLMRASELGFDLFYRRCNARLAHKEWLKDKKQLEREAKKRGHANVASFLNVVIGGNCCAVILFLCEFLSTKIVGIRVFTHQLYLRLKYNIS